MGMKRPQKMDYQELPVCEQGGRNKISYRTKAQAKRRARSGQYGKSPDSVRPYKCRECSYWHLTKQAKPKPWTLEEQRAAIDRGYNKLFADETNGEVE